MSNFIMDSIMIVLGLFFFGLFGYAFFIVLYSSNKGKKDTNQAVKGSLMKQKRTPNKPTPRMS